MPQVDTAALLNLRQPQKKSAASRHLVSVSTGAGSGSNSGANSDESGDEEEENQNIREGNYELKPKEEVPEPPLSC